MGKLFNKLHEKSEGNHDGEASATGNVTSILAIAFVVILAISAVCGSFYTLSETESAVVTTFGRADVNEDKGLQIKIPFIQKVNKINTTVRNFEVGYREDEEGNYTNIEDESIMITSDMNFIDIDFYVTYQVTDLLEYMYATENPEEILKNIVQSTIRGTLSAYKVDSALTTGKSEIQQNIKNIVMDELEKQKIGLSLIDISIQDVEPPTDQIKEAFSEVENARQNKESALNEANQYRNEQIPAAEAKADNIVQKAEAKKTARINEANGQAARFNSEYGEYIKYPLITKQRMFYETMEEIAPNLKIIISNDDGSAQRMYLGDIDGSMTGGNAGTAKNSETK
jgi:membrane protease subunit HflK